MRALRPYRSYIPINRYWMLKRKFSTSSQKSRVSNTVEKSENKSEGVAGKKLQRQSSHERLEDLLSTTEDHGGVRPRRDGGHKIGINKPETFDEIKREIENSGNYEQTGSSRKQLPDGSYSNKKYFRSKDDKVIVNVMDGNTSHSKPFSLTGPRAIHIKVRDDMAMLLGGEEVNSLVVHETLAGPEAPPEMIRAEYRRRKDGGKT